MRSPFTPHFFSLIGLMICIAGSPSHARNASGEDSKTAIDQVLRAQQQAWNHHDLEGFMAGYWNSSELTFFSGANEKDGWQATIERYRASYASPGHEMGHLEFSGLRIQILGADAAFVRGSWTLTMPGDKQQEGKSPHGLFTLVLRKFPGGWKIIHDHTSSAE